MSFLFYTKLANAIEIHPDRQIRFSTISWKRALVKPLVLGATGADTGKILKISELPIARSCLSPAQHPGVQQLEQWKCTTWTVGADSVLTDIITWGSSERERLGWHKLPFHKCLLFFSLKIKIEIYAKRGRALYRSITVTCWNHENLSF